MNIRNLKVLIVAILLVIAVGCKKEEVKEDPAPKDPAAATTDTEKAAPVAVPPEEDPAAHDKPKTD